jgi:hypothetical protein
MFTNFNWSLNFELCHCFRNVTTDETEWNGSWALSVAVREPSEQRKAASQRVRAGANRASSVHADGSRSDELRAGHGRLIQSRDAKRGCAPGLACGRCAPNFFFPIFQPPSQSTTRSCATTATCLGATTTTVALFYSKSYFERNFCR